MNKKELRQQMNQFDVSDITWDILPAKKSATEVTITLKSESKFNLLKIYLAFKAMCEKLELQMGIEPDGDPDEKH